MKEILDAAEELGKRIGASDRLKAVRAARKDLDTDEALQADMKALTELTQRIAALEKDVKPVEPEDKHRVRSLQQAITGSPKMQHLARCEADFAELMNRVNRTVRSQWGEAPADP